MELVDALYLSHCSERAYAPDGTPVAKPSVLELMMHERVGGRTARMDGKYVVFDLAESAKLFSLIMSPLFENPDTVAGVYPRSDYDFILFLGDDNGAFTLKVSKQPRTHGDFMRKLLNNQKVALNSDFLDVIDPTPLDGYESEVLGNPEKLDFFHSGVILPKQAGVPETYVSLWSHVPKMLEFIKPWVYQSFDPPYKLEMGTKVGIEGPYEITDITT